MADLSEKQVDLIAGYIKKNGVAHEGLFEDLLDHVCTSVERLMDQGVSFDEAFNQTIKLFGPGGLKQVQQQTFEIITEMNKTMKKVAFSFGLTSTILLLAGTIFKLMQWPGAGILIVLGAGLLVLVYLPLLLWHKLKESPGNEAIMHVAGYAGLTLTTLGVLFKIMHWPGAAALLIFGMGVLGVLYIPIFFFKRYKSSANKPVTLSTGLVAMTCLILAFALVSVRTSSEFDRAMALVNMDLQESNQRFENNDALYERLGDHPDAQTLKTAVDETYDYLDNLKIHLIGATEGISEDQARNMELRMLSKKYNHDVPTHLMWGVDETDPYHISHLIAALDDLENDVINFYPDELQADVKAIMPYNIHQNYTSHGAEEGWGEYHFYRMPLLSVVTQISKLQSDVRQLEAQTLVYLTSQLNAPAPPSESGAANG